MAATKIGEYNVVEVRCSVTKARFLAVRMVKEKMSTLRTRYIYGARTGNTEMVICSIRQHGIDTHRFRILSTHADYQTAMERKVELVQKDRASLCSVMPAWSGLSMVTDEKKGFFPIEVLGRANPAWGGNGADSDEGEEIEEG